MSALKKWMASNKNRAFVSKFKVGLLILQIVLPLAVYQTFKLGVGMASLIMAGLFILSMVLEIWLA